jgi:cystathionine beta-lyase/cystathionine gamma-synthase
VSGHSTSVPRSIPTSTSTPWAPATLAVRAGRRPDPTTGALVPPIVQSTTFAQAAIGSPGAHTYSRASNPTVAALEEALGALEDAPPGVAFASGMAAIAALVLTVARAGTEIVVSDPVYGGTVRLLRDVLARWGVRARFMDPREPEALGEAIGEATALVLVETPANPTLTLVDLEAAARTCRARGVPLAVDNTFLTPLVQRPLDLGADVTLESTTKYCDGHNVTVGGVLVSRDRGLLERLRLTRKTVGSIQSPLDAWLTLRGLTTLPLRHARQSRSAAAVARFLSAQPRVVRVLHPSLPGFPQRELALRQHGEGDDRHGAIVAFEVEGGEAAARRLASRLTLATLAENLGAAETLLTHPATMTHPDVPEAWKARAGITGGLLRLSVGLEDPSDLLRDLGRALEPDGEGEA